MRTLIAWAVTISMAAMVYGGHHYDEIKWHHTLVKFEYHCRGRLQTWLMQVRTFTANEIALLGAVVLVFVWSVATINK